MILEVTVLDYVLDSCANAETETIVMIVVSEKLRLSIGKSSPLSSRPYANTKAQC